MKLSSPVYILKSRAKDLKKAQGISLSVALDDIRLPNPLDLGLLNKIILLYRESRRSTEVDVIFGGRFTHSFKVGLDIDEARIFDR